MLRLKVTREILSLSNPSFRNIPSTTVEDTARRTRPTSISQAQSRKAASRAPTTSRRVVTTSRRGVAAPKPAPKPVSRTTQFGGFGSAVEQQRALQLAIQQSKSRFPTQFKKTIPAPKSTDRVTVVRSSGKTAVVTRSTAAKLAQRGQLSQTSAQQFSPKPQISAQPKPEQRIQITRKSGGTAIVTLDTARKLAGRGQLTGASASVFQEGGALFRSTKPTQIDVKTSKLPPAGVAGIISGATTTASLIGDIGTVATPTRARAGRGGGAPSKVTVTRKDGRSISVTPTQARKLAKLGALSAESSSEFAPASKPVQLAPKPIVSSGVGGGPIPAVPRTAEIPKDINVGGTFIGGTTTVVRGGPKPSFTKKEKQSSLPSILGEGEKKTKAQLRDETLAIRSGNSPILSIGDIADTELRKNKSVFDTTQFSRGGKPIERTSTEGKVIETIINEQRVARIANVAQSDRFNAITGAASGERALEISQKTRTPKVFFTFGESATGKSTKGLLETPEGRETLEQILEESPTTQVTQSFGLEAPPKGKPTTVVLGSKPLIKTPQKTKAEQTLEALGLTPTTRQIETGFVQTEADGGVVSPTPAGIPVPVGPFQAGLLGGATLVPFVQGGVKSKAESQFAPQLTGGSTSGFIPFAEAKTEGQRQALNISPVVSREVTKLDPLVTPLPAKTFTEVFDRDIDGDGIPDERVTKTTTTGGEQITERSLITETSGGPAPVEPDFSNPFGSVSRGFENFLENTFLEPARGITDLAGIDTPLGKSKGLAPSAIGILEGGILETGEQLFKGNIGGAFETLRVSGVKAGRVATQDPIATIVEGGLTAATFIVPVGLVTRGLKGAGIGVKAISSAVKSPRFASKSAKGGDPLAKTLVGVEKTVAESKAIGRGGRGVKKVTRASEPFLEKGQKGLTVKQQNLLATTGRIGEKPASLEASIFKSGSGAKNIFDTGTVVKSGVKQSITSTLPKSSRISQFSNLFRTSQFTKTKIPLGSTKKISSSGAKVRQVTEAKVDTFAPVGTKGFFNGVSKLKGVSKAVTKEDRAALLLRDVKFTPQKAALGSATTKVVKGEKLFSDEVGQGFSSGARGAGGEGAGAAGKGFDFGGGGISKIATREGTVLAEKSTLKSANIFKPITKQGVQTGTKQVAKTTLATGTKLRGLTKQQSKVLTKQLVAKQANIKTQQKLAKLIQLEKARQTTKFVGTTVNIGKAGKLTKVKATSKASQKAAKSIDILRQKKRFSGLAAGAATGVGISVISTPSFAPASVQQPTTSIKTGPTTRALFEPTIEQTVKPFRNTVETTIPTDKVNIKKLQNIFQVEDVVKGPRVRIVEKGGTRLVRDPKFRQDAIFTPFPPTAITGTKIIQTPKTIITTVPTEKTTTRTNQFIREDIFKPVPVVTEDPVPIVPPVTGGRGGIPPFFGFGGARTPARSTRRIGKIFRVFDVAKTPFGRVERGLGLQVQSRDPIDEITDVLPRRKGKKRIKSSEDVFAGLFKL